MKFMLVMVAALIAQTYKNIFNQQSWHTLL